MKIIILLLSFLITTQAMAWLCPNNFTTINPGDTLVAVKAACGNPVSQKKSVEPPDVPQEWGYYVPVNPPNPATIRVSVVIVHKKIAGITVNATSLVSTSLCGSTISIGQSMAVLQSACGSPMFVNKQPPKPGQKPTFITELTYGGSAPNTLVFENGLLKERK